MIYTGWHTDASADMGLRTDVWLCLAVYDRGHKDSIGMTPTYHQVSNIRHTLAGNTIVDHSDVVGASPLGAAPTTSSFSI